jgi:hypothetical protein
VLDGITYTYTVLVKDLNPSTQENLEVLLSSDNNSYTPDLRVQAKSNDEVQFVYIKCLLLFFFQYDGLFTFDKSTPVRAWTAGGT